MDENIKTKQEAMQAQYDELKNKQIQLGREIKAGNINDNIIYEIVEVHESRVEMKAGMGRI